MVGVIVIVNIVIDIISSSFKLSWSLFQFFMQCNQCKKGWTLLQTINHLRLGPERTFCRDFHLWMKELQRKTFFSTRLVDVLRLAAGVLCRKKSLITKTLRVHLSLQRRGYSSSIFKSCFTKMATMPVLKPPKQINLKAATGLSQEIVLSVAMPE